MTVDDGWEGRMAQRARDRAQAELVAEREAMRRKTATMGLIYRRWDPWETVVEEPVTGRECWKCGKERPDLAHAVYEYVAALLAERLRRAHDDHQASCTRCQTPGPWGWGQCPERVRLCELMPAGDWPVAVG